MKLILFAAIQILFILANQFINLFLRIKPPHLRQSLSDPHYEAFQVGFAWH